MKKFISVLLAVMMIMTLAVTAFADETGSITIKQTVADQKYSVYKMATLDSYDVSKDAYLYTPVAEWKAFFETDNAEYFDINAQGNIILKDGVTIDAAAFAKDALAYAKDNGIAITGEEKTSAADNADVVFDGLALGYYLVDSSLGALCDLTTTAPNAEVNEKNAKPEDDKKVKEDSDSSWGDTNDADTFQTINYKTTVTVQKGALNYVLHDEMAEGLTFDEIESVKIGETDVAAANYTVKTTGITDGCTFEIVFDNDYVATLEAGTNIVVSYTAHLNENAVIAGEGNKNETWLDYGEEGNTSHTTPSITTTYTYQFDLVKTDSSKTLLDGAEIKLYKGADGTDAFWFLQDSDGYYVVAKGTEGATDTLVVTDGKITVRGLDSDTYSIEETKAPDGYNMLTARKSFTIDGTNLSATMNATDPSKYEDGGVWVENKTGSILPETGGLGAALFIVFGGIVVLGTGVLLFAKKRMSQIEE